MTSSLTLLSRALGDLGRSLGPLVGYAVLFYFAALLVLGPATAGLMGVLIETTGYGAVGNQAIAAFLLSPAGLAAALLWGTLALTTSYVEQAGFLLIAQAKAQGQKPGPLVACVLTARRLPALLNLALRQAVWYATVALPFLGVVGAAYLGLWADYDLYYLTAAQPPMFWVGAGIAGAAAAGYAVVALRQFLRWLVALPILLRTGIGPAAALRASVERTRGRHRRNLAALMIGAAGLAAVGALVAWGFDAAGEALLHRVGSDMKRAVPVAGVLLAVHVGLTTALKFAGTVGHALLIRQIDAEETGSAVQDRDAVPVETVDLHGWSPRRRELVAAGVVALGGLTVTGSLALVAALGEPPWPTITAHRGASLDAPENSVAAIRAAIVAGADAAEIDVQLSSDGAVVVLHDEDLRRLTGDRRRVADLTLAELRQVDAGSHFHSSFRGEPIPTLEEILAVAGDQLGLNIELKVPAGTDPAPLVRRVLSILGSEQSAAPRVISSLSHSALSEVRRQDPNRTIGFIVFEALGNATRLDVDFLSVRAPLATAVLVAEARRRGQFVAAWTVSDPARFDTLAGRGVADVMTNNPRALVDHRRALADLDPPERLLLWYRRAVLE